MTRRVRGRTVSRNRRSRRSPEEHAISIPGLVRAFAAIALAIAVLAAKLALFQVTGFDVGYTILIPAPVLAALLWGLGPGAIATFVVAAGNVFIFLTPIAPTDASSLEQLKLLLFVIVGLLGSFVGEALRLTRLRAERQRDLAEQARERAERLTSAASSLAVALTPAQAAAATLGEAVGYLRGTAGALLLLEGDGARVVAVVGGLVPEGSVASDDASADPDVLPSDPTTSRIVRHLAAVAQRPMDSDAGSPDASDDDAPSLPGGGRLLMLAIRSTRGQALGAVGVVVPADRSVAADDFELLRTLADLAGQAIERARLYDDETRLLAELREREALRDAFTGVLSHELRTPVTTIYGATQLLARGTTPEHTAELLDDVRQEAGRLHRIVEDLLVLTRAERGILEVEPEPVLIQRLGALIAHEVEQRFAGVPIAVDLGIGLPPVLADETGLRQVLRNLLVNAIRYGDPPFELTARTSGADLEIVVRDHGPGVPEDERAQLWDLFYRAPSNARRSAGTGIGLYVVRQLVEAMGGHVDVADANPGLAFTIELHIARAELVDDASASRGGAQNGASTPRDRAGSDASGAATVRSPVDG
ncbi:MAG: ATP-binding protein [Chloroflexota bacterium]